VARDEIVAVYGGQERRATALLGLLAASPSHAAGSRFYEHYYIQLISPQLACRAVLRAALDRTDTALTGCYDLLSPMLGCGHHCCLLYPHWLGAARRLPSRRDAIWLDHSARTTGFSSGAINRIYIEARRRPAVGTSYLFPHGLYFSANPQVSTSRIVSVPGRCLSQDFGKHPQHTLSIFLLARCTRSSSRLSDSGQAFGEQYQPVARTA